MTAKGHGRVLAQLTRAEVVYVSYDNQAQRPRRVPKEVRQAFEHFEKTGEPLPLDGIPLFAEAKV